MRPVGLRRPPPMTPISARSRPRNVERRSIHWANSSRRWTSTSVEQARRAVNAAATTVLPNPVVAASTPVSCASKALTAACCSLWSCADEAERHSRRRFRDDQ